MSGVEVEGISKRFGATPVLDAISMDFAPGRFTSLLGPSGSGKTTLLRIIGGFTAPDAGRVRIAGEDVTDVPLWRRRIGMVFQSYALFPHMSVAENVAYGLRRQGLRGRAVADEVGRALSLVELGGLEARRPQQLSGGQQQRVALARAIVTKPRVLLLDEPLSALDRRLRQAMQIELKRIQQNSGLTTIFVTHDQEEALALSDHVAILDQGRIVQQGPPREIYERPRTRFAATFLGEANLFEGVVRVGTVETAVGILRTTDPLPPDGTRITLAVRPERIRLLSEGAEPDRNVMTAILQGVVYVGSTSTFLLVGNANNPVRVSTAQNQDHRPELGGQVRLTWTMIDTIALND